MVVEFASAMGRSSVPGRDGNDAFSATAQIHHIFITRTGVRGDEIGDRYCSLPACFE